MIGTKMGFKPASSAFCPPEIARFELEQASGQTPTEVIASEKLDVWHLGLMLLQVSKYNVMTLALPMTQVHLAELSQQRSCVCNVCRMYM